MRHVYKLCLYPSLVLAATPHPERENNFSPAQAAAAASLELAAASSPQPAGRCLSPTHRPPPRRRRQGHRAPQASTPDAATPDGGTQPGPGATATEPMPELTAICAGK
uniref:Uncharacterized protein n=1 Tax=Arundo donax TaxID=35708 RepID=A0A0A9CRJ3_ARUDO